MGSNLTGKRLGQYEIGEVIGHGGLTTVYQAYQPSLERWVAIKILHSDDERLLARFDREAKTVAQLHHPNILPIYEYGIQDGWPYIVMQFIEQGSLENYLVGEPMDELRVIDLATSIAEALDYAHARGLIHRDIKPSNILMPREDWPLLADFGLVKKAEASERSLTQSDITIGTPSYISPEQVDGRKVDARADIYSLGVMLFEMITGRLPFQYDNINTLMLAHVSESPPLPRDVNPNCSIDVQKIILTAMRKSPIDRYPNIRAMLRALRTFTAKHTTSRLAVSNNERKSPPPSFSSPPPSKSSPPPVLSKQTQAIAKASRLPDQKPQLLIRSENITVDLLAPIGKDEMIIGRSSDTNKVDIDLGNYGAAEAGISRRHARLVKRDDYWLLNDLDSTNGTYVNSIKLVPGLMMRLKNGDDIRFGLMECIFLMAPET